jgi:phosphate transport system permease protein
MGGGIFRLTRQAVASLGDPVFRLFCQVAASLIILLAVVLVGVICWKAWLAIVTIGVRFFTETTWDPADEHRVFGALAFVYGTVATSFIAMVIAVPLGVGTAAYLSEIAPRWLRRAASFLVEMLAAIPSVVYGYWGLSALAPRLQTIYTWMGGPNHGGVGIFAAGLILSIMIIPYVTAVSFDACQAVPQSQRAGALSLGATRWQMIWSVVLPYARPGIIGSCFLALGRALGETMAVTMLIGNHPEIPWPLYTISLYDLGDSIASCIANQFGAATYDLYLSALVYLGLVLFLLTVVVNAAARLFIWRIGRTGRTSGKSLLSAIGSAVFRARPTAASPPRVADQSATPPVFVRLHGYNRFAQSVNHAMTVALGACLFVTVVPLFLILAYLVAQGLGSINWDFFTKLPLEGGMANALVGSCVLIVLATAFAVPVGLLAAVYLAEYRSDRLGPTVRFVGELLGGVPSIVIGILAYTAVVLPMGHASGWAGSLALGFIMIPIVMRASEEALKLVPTSLRYASYALGASHWQTVLRVTVPAALPAIITGVFLAIARIGGETAPLLLTAGDSFFFPTSPNDLTPSLPVKIFNYAISPSADQHRQAWAAALVLMTGVMFLNFGIRYLTGKRLISASRAE